MAREEMAQAQENAITEDNRSEFVQTVLREVADREETRSGNDWRGRLTNWIKC